MFRHAFSLRPWLAPAIALGRVPRRGARRADNGQRAVQNNVVRPDLLTATGQGLEVLSAGWVRDRIIEYIVKGSGPMTVTYDSVKGGRAAATLTLK